MVASRGLFRYRFDELLRPGRKFQRSFVNGQLLVMKWHKLRLRGRGRGRLKATVRKNCCHQKNVHQCKFEKEKPAQPHQLIPSKSRKRPAHPHKQENHDGDLCEKDCDVDQAEDPSVEAIWYPRKMPAAEK